MKLRIDQASVASHGLTLAGQLASASLRIIEIYREAFRDVDDTVITLVVMALSAEGHAACTASSISAASGISRETVRRKVARLTDVGLLRRGERGSILLAEDFLGKAEVTDAILRHAREIIRQANLMIDQGVAVPKTA